MAMEIEELQKLADSFFEWPTEDRTQVTLTSAQLFAQHVLRMAQQAEPVEYQFYDPATDRWHVFMNERHRIATEEAGYKIRALYTAPQAQPAPIPRNERMPALADADPFGMVAWWNSFDNFWVLTNWDSKPARPIFTHWRHTGLIMPPAPGGE